MQVWDSLRRTQALLTFGEVEEGELATGAGWQVSAGRFHSSILLQLQPLL